MTNSIQKNLIYSTVWEDQRNVWSTLGNPNYKLLRAAWETIKGSASYMKYGLLKSSGSDLLHGRSSGGHTISRKPFIQTATRYL